MQVFHQATPRRRYSPRPGLALLGLLLVILTASAAVGGCATRPSVVDDSLPPGAPVAATASAGADAGGSPIEIARTKAMAAYSGYITAETQASQTADYGSPELSKFAASPLLGQWVAQLFHLHVIGYVQRGSVISHPILTSLTLSARSGTATIRDCLDQSKITIVNARTGAKVALPKSKPYVAVATLYLYANGAWMVSTVDTTGSQPC
jgi:hypothetical protein